MTKQPQGMEGLVVKTAATNLKSLWQAYLASRHDHDFDEHGECRGCGKIPGDW